MGVDPADEAAFESDEYEMDEAQPDETVVEPEPTVSPVATTSRGDAEFMFGTTASEEEEINKLMQNKHLNKYFDILIDRKLQQAKKSAGMAAGKKKNQITVETLRNKIEAIRGPNNTQVAAGMVNMNRGNIVKSPSDTTIYRPALRKESPVANGKTMLNRISNFVESIRNEEASTSRGQQFSRQLNDSDHDNEGEQTQFAVASQIRIPGLDEAQKRAQDAVVEAEKFKATVEQPGMIIDTNIAPLNVGTGLSDDDFFHLTCHIEPQLISKIERGEYVELEKLLHKERGVVKHRFDKNRLEWVQSSDGTFLQPVNDRENRITGLRKWEQAFRVYVTIYCGANPNRAKEIWQYIAIINSAASSVPWENVYEYDIIFRRLMAFNPARSWAVTYTQLWNICMRDTSGSSHGNTGSSNNRNNFRSKNYWNSNNNNFGGQSNSNSRQKPKSDYCWSFNKEVKCKFGPKCRFIERCSYCDATSHGVISCPKLAKKNGSNGRNHSPKDKGKK